MNNVVCLNAARVSPEGLRLAILDSEKQRVDSAINAVDYNIQKIMIEQIAPLLDKKRGLEQRQETLSAEMQQLLDLVRNRA
jgi:hypothetical protein